MSPRILHILAVALLVALASPGCKKEGDKAEQAAKDKAKVEKAEDGDKKTPDEPEAGGGGEDAPPPGAPEVKLIEAGAEPRRTIRLTPSVGDKQTIEMLMKVQMEMDMGGAGGMPAMVLPTTKIIMDISVKEVAGNGDIKYEFAMSDADVIAEEGAMPQVVDAMRTALKSVKGMSGPGTVSSRGFNKGMELNLPPGADPLMKQSMDQMKDAMNQLAAALPEEPIGVGGKWEVHMTVTTQGMKIKQTAAYEVTKMEEGKIEVTTKIKQHADPQKVVNPSMPTVDIDLVSLESGGGGDMKMDLTRIAPHHAKLEMASKAEMAVNLGGKKQNTKVSTKINMTMEGK